MTPQAPWSPTAHAFAHHQFSHVANFWKQGRPASFRLEALPGGHAQLNITFQLPSASEVIPPPFHASPVPAPQRPIHPLFPRGCFPQKSFANLPNPTSAKKISSRQGKSYRRSVLRKAALAASSLPPPKKGSLRQAAQACAERLQAKSALPVNTPSERKRPPPSTTPVLSPSNYSPLAQRIRLDLQLGASEDSPEREGLRGLLSPKTSPLPISPQNVKRFPPPAPLAFTPQTTKYETETQTSESKDVESIEEVAMEAEVLKCCNCDGEMTLDHQCEISDSDGNWEDFESEEDSYPTLDLNSEDWADKFTNSIRRFHGSNP